MKPFTGFKDVDLKILSDLEDVDLFKICSKGYGKEGLDVKNSYIHHLCSNETFWRNRSMKFNSKYKKKEKHGRDFIFE